MTWQPPRTWNPGLTVTATMLNTEIRDNMNALAKSRCLAVSFGDAGGGTLPTGIRGYVEIPFACNVVGWTILAAQSGSIVIDIYRDSYANFPPVVGDTITGSEKPTLASAQKNQDLSLSTWAPAIAAGDILAFNIDSVSGIKQVTLGLRLEMA